MKTDNYSFNDYRMNDYYTIKRLCKDGLVNPRPNSITSSYKPHYSVEKIKTPIKIDPANS